MIGQDKDFFISSYPLRSDTYHIQLKNFQPTPKFRVRLAEMVDNILRAAPSDAFLKLVLKKKPTHYSGRCCLYSKAGGFKSYVHAYDAMESLHRLEAEIWHQLDGWKLERLKNYEPTG